MSPTEDVRNQAYAILADSQHGINAEFIQQCTDRSIPIPVAQFGSTEAQPFDFGPYSRNVFLSRSEIDWLAEQIPGNAIGYPNLQIYGVSANQVLQDGRPYGAKYWGDVTIELRSYLAWTNDNVPAANNYEAPLDALEEAFLNVLNRDSNMWASPALYHNMLSISERVPLRRTLDGRLLRCGLRMTLTCRYLQALFD